MYGYALLGGHVPFHKDIFLGFNAAARESRTEDYTCSL
jgi:hypothetical protein